MDRRDPREGAISGEASRITARRAEKHRKWKCLVAAVTPCAYLRDFAPSLPLATPRRCNISV